MADYPDLDEKRVRLRAYHLWEQAGRQDNHGNDFSNGFWLSAEAAILAEEAAYDETLEESFPASDPPGHANAL